MKVTLSFTLDDQQDRDILRQLKGLPKRSRSRMIRDALRAYTGHSGVSLADIYQVVNRIERKLASGIVTQGPATEPEIEEPPDAVAALDSL